jgi:hypothetical protein
MKYFIQLTPLPRIDDRGGVSVHNEQKMSCWSNRLVERDWQKLRGKRLYNHTDTVCGFFHPVLREVFFKNISRIFLCVDKIF